MVRYRKSESFGLDGFFHQVEVSFLLHWVGSVVGNFKGAVNEGEEFTG
jgi:hypothetical protein